MKAQEISNCMLAAVKLQDASPAVLDAVPALAKRIPDKVEDMVPQALSNCLWAAATLQDSASAVLDTVPAIVQRMQMGQIPPQIGKMAPEGLQMSLKAARRLGEEELAAKLQAELDSRRQC